MPPVTPPKPTWFQSFVRLVTFGIVDLRPKVSTVQKNRSASPAQTAPKAKDGKQREIKRKERGTFPVTAPTNTRLFIGNLAYSVTSEDLQSLFSTHGSVVEAVVVTQSGSTRSKGFGFVEMGSIEEAVAAAAALHDHELQGRKLIVSGAKDEDSSRSGRDGQTSGKRETRTAHREERKEDSRGGNGRRERRTRGSRSRGGEEEGDSASRRVRPPSIEVVESPSLEVSNVNAKAEDVDIDGLFEGIGTIVTRSDLGVSENAETRKYRIDLADVTEAQKAVELLDSKHFMGLRISVRGAKAE